MAEIYYGIKEVADVLGWDRAKVVMYKKRGKLVDPHGYMGETGKRPVWTKEQVERIKALYGREIEE